jgi:hypothetical protein
MHTTGIEFGVDLKWMDIVMKRQDMQPRCANCQIVITWLPTIVDGQVYCCPGCAEGGPCDCDYGHLPQTKENSAIVVHRSRNSSAEVLSSGVLGGLRNV